MLAHRLRHRIEFQELIEDQDSETGSIVNYWATAHLDMNTALDSVPAEVMTGPGREFRGGGTTQSEAAARINLRWFPGLLPSWRVLWDGRVLNIASIETDITGRREYWLRCTDGVSDGR